MRPHRDRPALALIAVLVLSPSLARADDDAKPPGPAKGTSPAGPVIHLRDGGFAPGTLHDSETPGTIRWQAAPFATPFDFALKDVKSIHYPAPAETPKPEGDYAFELAGGDVLYGSLLDLGETEATIEVPRLGALKIDRSRLVRIDRWKGGADMLYLGPNGLAGWRKAAVPKTDGARNGMAAIRMRGNNAVPAAKPATKEPENPWREESGHLVTDKAGVALQSEFQLPEMAGVEFEVAWNDKPDFVLALGVGDDYFSVASPMRFEVWDGELVLMRETGNDADVTSLGKVEPGPGRFHPHVFLDQGKGRIVVFSPQWGLLADMTVPPPTGPRKWYPSIYFANNGGEIRLERLRIAKWSGDVPREVKSGKSRVHRADGSIAYGKVVKYDPASKEFVIREDGSETESRLAEGTIASVLLAQPPDEPPTPLRVVYQDGLRLGGTLTKVEKGDLWLSVRGLKDTLRMPSAGLGSLVVVQKPEKAPKPAETASPPVTPQPTPMPGPALKAARLRNARVVFGPDGRPIQNPTLAAPGPPPKNDGTGVLEMEGLKLPGRLAEATEKDGSSCLAWKPTASQTAAALKPGSSGRIVYREPPPPAPVQPQQAVNGFMMPQMGRPVRPVPPMMLAKAFLKVAFGEEVDSAPIAAGPGAPVGGRRSLYLRSGDVIPSTVTKIDEDGVWFKTPMSDSTFVKHDKVKAVELTTPPPATVRLTKSKRDRLLTLPRMQRDSPPTQLIRSTNGDYLRGRVVAMDAKNLQVEVRLETKEVRRDRVARIIWLHADELDAKKAVPPPERPGATRVQTLRSDGIRLTFFADSFDGKALSGKSDVLGVCRAPLPEVDQVLFGKAIDQAAATLVYQQWKLKNAVEPKYVTADDASPGNSGTDAALVGKPAPDFKLELLDGKTFRLADTKGKVVVLDFWATWCGPCLQAMPQVDRVTREFKDRGVELIAVNLQESPKQIKSMLERHKLDMTVALDVDGGVAQKYGAEAIPQTVIIGRDGNVARLFVGGGPHFDDQLRDALKVVLDGPKDKAADEKKGPAPATPAP